MGRPDDGTDTTGFFNTEYFVDLKPKEQWRPVFHENKDELIAAMDRELEKIPGVLWNFSQPIADNMEEAVSGVKGRAGGQDLRRRSEDARSRRATRSSNVMRTIPGVAGSRALPRHRPAESELHRRSRRRPAATGSMSPTSRMRSRRPWAARPSARCCRASSATTWWCATSRRTATPSEAIEQHPPAGAFRRARFAGQLCNIERARRRFGDLPRRQLALRRDQVQRARARPGQHGRRGDREGAASR